MKNTIIFAVLIIAGLGLLVYKNNQNNSSVVENEKAIVKEGDAMIKDEGIEKDGEVMVKDEVKTTPGSYVDYASANLANAKTNVLFFNASWCPSCRSTVKDINANLGNIPSDMQIISVDYDTYKDLKKQYGVTSQHTFVKVDQQGNKLSVWSGGDFSDIIIKAK